MSGHGTFLSRRSCVAAKTEVPTQSGLLLPYEWLFIQLTAHRKRNPACGWTKSGPWPVEILSSFGRNLCAAHTNDEAPCLGVAAEQRRRMAAIYSRSLHSRRRPRRSCAAAKTGRGTCRPTTIDVLMFHFRVRNGTGWDHQAMTTRFQEAASFSLLAYLAVICACGLLCCVCWLPSVGSRLTSAWLACLL